VVTNNGLTAAARRLARANGVELRDRPAPVGRLLQLRRNDVSSAEWQETSLAPDDIAHYEARLLVPQPTISRPGDTPQASYPSSLSSLTRAGTRSAGSSSRPGCVTIASLARVGPVDGPTASTTSALRIN
jgi:hypothetical protein